MGVDLQANQEANKEESEWINVYNIWLIPQLSLWMGEYENQSGNKISEYVCF